MIQRPPEVRKQFGPVCRTELLQCSFALDGLACAIRSIRSSYIELLKLAQQAHSKACRVCRGPRLGQQNALAINTCPITSSKIHQLAAPPTSFRLPASSSASSAFGTSNVLMIR